MHMFYMHMIIILRYLKKSQRSVRISSMIAEERKESNKQIETSRGVEMPLLWEISTRQLSYFNPL